MQWSNDEIIKNVSAIVRRCNVQTKQSSNDAMVRQCNGQKMQWSKFEMVKPCPLHIFIVQWSNDEMVKTAQKLPVQCSNGAMVNSSNMVKRNNGQIMQVPNDALGKRRLAVGRRRRRGVLDESAGGDGCLGLANLL